LKVDHTDMFEQILPALKARVRQRLKEEAELENEEQGKTESDEREPTIVAKETKVPLNQSDESAL
ncbi:MAG TPA: hypothetical protein DEQ40_07775, partial [Oxalobacteraceae bacterium]|nr:hypothetical protein [Oxalobacteraceae bacterium]